MLPRDLQQQLEFSGLLIDPAKTTIENDDEKEALVRLSIRKEYKLQMTYVKGAESQRTIWPVALFFFEEIHIAVAWCELREDFRHFRIDRMTQLNPLESRYPQRRQSLIKKWRELHNIPEQSSHSMLTETVSRDH